MMAANRIIQPIQSEIYAGIRDERFKTMIIDTLNLARLSDEYIAILTTPESLQEYSKAFTASSADPINNYEMYEQLGDASAGNFLVWYFYDRFPQLACTKGIPTISRLKAKYGSTKVFHKIADNLGFWDYISASVQGTNKKLKYRFNRKELLEDCFEAFIGVTQYLIDKRTMFGAGYIIVWNFMKGIFDKMDISIKYDDLVDPISQLKELFDRQDIRNGRGYFYTGLTDEITKNPLTNYKIYLIHLDDRIKKIDNKQQFTKVLNDVLSKDILTEYLSQKNPLDPERQDNFSKEIISNRPVLKYTLIGESTLPSKTEAVITASRMALETLRNKYNIFRPQDDGFVC